MSSCGSESGYIVAGTVKGLSANGLVLEDKGADDITVALGASSFQFPMQISPGGSYDVQVGAQPAGLTCTVNDGSGSNVQGPISNVTVSCSVQSYTVGGTVKGLSANGLVLKNNGADDITVALGASSFQFPMQISPGGSYDVQVGAQPAGLTCTVNDGSGSNVQGPISNVTVSCSVQSYTVGGTITGLTASGLILENNGTDHLMVAADATTFVFPTAISATSGYHVVVATQPAGFTCTVSGGVESNVRADSQSIHVTCSPVTVTLGGTVTGLTAAGLVLQSNGTDDLSIAAHATTFKFPTPVAYESSYLVTVSTQPPGENCLVTDGHSTASANVTDIAVTCTAIPTFIVTTSSGPNGIVSPNGSVTVTSGASQNFLATPNASYGVYQWILDSSVVQTGGDVYTLSHVLANHTLRVTSAQSTLTPSVSELDLSINNTSLNAALTGNSRQIVLSNTGSIPATNVAISYPTWPTGTTAASTCSTTLAPAASCTITVTPGANSTTACTSGIAPTPGVVSITSAESAATLVAVSVLGYGCVLEGGNVFAVDDTTPSTGSIGGKVATATDQASNISWSPGGDFFDIPGITETSTSPCVGNTDGACNSTQITTHYAGSSASTYAAGLCTASISGFSDWYLPAICELGFDTYGEGTGCGSTSSPLIQNIESDLVLTGVSSAPSGAYWGSTEISSLATDYAFGQIFGFAQQQFGNTKDASMAVRCARALTP